METNRPNWVQWVTMILAAVLIIGGLFYLPNTVGNAVQAGVGAAISAETTKIIAAMPDTPVIPTAEDIAALIDIDIPETSQQLLEGVYSGKVEILEDDCQTALWDEFDSDYLDEIQDLIEDSEGEDLEDDLTTGSIIEWNYKNSYDFTVIDLGIDDEETRAGEIAVTFKVEYALEDEPTDIKRDKVYITGTCSDWDKDDGEFDTVEATFIL